MLEGLTLLKNPEACDVISLSGQIMACHQGDGLQPGGNDTLLRLIKTSKDAGVVQEITCQRKGHPRF
jgi:hypothetical protein